MDALQKKLERDRFIADAISHFEERYSSLVREFSSKEGDRDDDAFLVERQSLRDALVDSVLAAAQEETHDYNYQTLFFDALERVYKLHVAAASAAAVLQAKIKKHNETNMFGPDDKDEWDDRRFFKRLTLVTDLWLLNETIEIVGLARFSDPIISRILQVKE